MGCYGLLHRECFKLFSDVESHLPGHLPQDSPKTGQLNRRPTAHSTRRDEAQTSDELASQPKRGPPGQPMPPGAEHS
jgi:hypothetical protein